MVELLGYAQLSLPLLKRGKVRELYKLNGHILMVTTDRISAFDVVFNELIPYKGVVLNRLSALWFEKTKNIIKNHMVSVELPDELDGYREALYGRAMITLNAEPIPVEAIVRGYLAGSSYKEYRKKGSVCGIPLPGDLDLGSRLPEPIFTPSTKEEAGTHDQNITFEEMMDRVGKGLSNKIKELSLELYRAAHSFALERGLVLADTKFEFGIYQGELILIDEALTPDSSRYWKLSDYEKGRITCMDKQYIRDYLEGLDWDKSPPPPKLPKEVVEEASRRYRELYHMLTGETIP